MKNKLMIFGIVCVSSFMQMNAVLEGEREDRKHAHVLVKYVFSDRIRETFADGYIGTINRKRLREEILDECPISFRDANKRSIAGLLVWREKRFLNGEPLEHF